MPIDGIPSSFAALSVVPAPKYGSRTISLRFVANMFSASSANERENEAYTETKCPNKFLS
ncbi:hypothetical protein MCRY_03130 [Marivita cryptomonadis]|nr:hypothetical protein MCRY_03130 [Marivita cryptomonadis]